MLQIIKILLHGLEFIQVGQVYSKFKDIWILQWKIA